MADWAETHLPCPCGSSSDAYSVNTDGWGQCFSCDKRFPPDGDTPTTERKAKVTGDVVYNGDYRDKPKRRLNAETLKRFGYKLGEFKGEAVEFAPYHDANGNLIGTKIRGPNKSFKVTGTLDDQLFGRKLWGSGGKRLVITEGEIDALSYAQATDLNWPVVSVPNGAQSAVKAIKKNIDWIESFKEVVFLFDNDEPGREGARKAAEVIRPGKAKIGVIPPEFKDANDMLVEGETHALLQTVWNAEPYGPDGIVNAKDLWDKVNKPLVMGTPYPWKCLNEKLFGLRPKEIVTLTAGTGIGKSTLSAEIAHHVLTTERKKVGYIALEEGVDRSVLRFMAIEVNKPIHLPGYEVSEEDRRAAFNKVTEGERLFLYDHFGSLSGSGLITKLRYMIIGLGCEYLVLDHLSILVSSMDFEDGLDERKELDKTMTQLRSLTEETGASMIVVSHLKRKEGKSHEDGGRISLSDLRGSQSIAQLSDAVIGVERDQQSEEDSNVMTLRILKNRYAGMTGVAGQLSWSSTTGRVSELDEFGESDGPLPWEEDGEEGGDF